MPFDPQKARDFVRSVDLAGTPRGIIAQGAAEEAGEVFSEARKQAQVVGSGVFSFSQGVTVKVREAISDSALLAQLVANKKTSFDKDTEGWFKAYSEVLGYLGWTVQESGWADYTTSSKGAEVHERILEIAVAALGPSPAALTLIKASVDALKAMKSGSSWLTIFSRESQKASIARFQVGLVSKDEKGDVFVSMLACVLAASNINTQVLLFKFKDTKATFKANGAKVSINAAALEDLAPTIRTKTRAYQADYVSTILDMPV